MSFSIEQRNFNSDTQENIDARKKIRQLLDTPYDGTTPNGELKYLDALFKLRQLELEFPEVYARVVFLRAIKYFRQDNIRKRYATNS